MYVDFLKSSRCYSRSLNTTTCFFFSPRTKTQPIMKTLHFIAQCSLRNAMLSFTVQFFCLSASFAPILKKMLDFIQHFFLLFIFFLKRKEIIIFEDIIKEKNCLMLTRRKSVEFPVSRQINYRLLKKLTNDES